MSDIQNISDVVGKIPKKNMAICDHCGSQFTQKRNLKAHIRSIHDKNKPFRCHLCEVVIVIS